MNNHKQGVYSSVQKNPLKCDRHLNVLCDFPFLPFRQCLPEESMMNYSFGTNSGNFMPNNGPHMINSLVDTIEYYPPVIPYTQSLGDAERKMAEMSYAQSQNWNFSNIYDLDHRPEYDYSYTSTKSKVMFYDSLWNVSSQEETIRYWMQNYPNCIVEIIKVADNNLKKVVVKDVFEDNTPEYSLALSTIGILTNVLSIAEGLKFMMRILHIFEFYDLLVWSLLYLDSPAALDLKKEILKCVYYATFCPKAVCRFRHNENLYKVLRLYLKQSGSKDTVEKALLITQNLLYNITESKCSNYVIDRLPIEELKYVAYSSQSDLQQLSNFILKKIDKLRHFYQTQNEKIRRKKRSEPKRFVSTLNLKPRSFEKEVKAVEELFMATFPEKDKKKKRRPLTAPEKISLEKVVADRSVSCIYFNEKVSEKIIKKVSESKNVSTQVDLVEDNISVIDSLVNLNSELIEEIVSFRNEVKSIYGEDYEKQPETPRKKNNGPNIASLSNTIDVKGYFVENEQIQLCHKKISVKEEDKDEDSKTFEKIVVLRESPHSSYIIVEELERKDSNATSVTADDDDTLKYDIKPTVNIAYYELKKETHDSPTIEELNSHEESDNGDDSKGTPNDDASSAADTKNDSVSSVLKEESYLSLVSSNKLAEMSEINNYKYDKGNLEDFELDRRKTKLSDISENSSFVDSERSLVDAEIVVDIIITDANEEPNTFSDKIVEINQDSTFDDKNASGDAEEMKKCLEGDDDFKNENNVDANQPNDNSLKNDYDCFTKYITEIKQKYFDDATIGTLDEQKHLNECVIDNEIGDGTSESITSEERSTKKLHSNNADGDAKSDGSTKCTERDSKDEETEIKKQTTLDERPKMFDDASFAEFISEVKKKFYDVSAVHKTINEESEGEDTFVDDTKFKTFDKISLHNEAAATEESKEDVNSKIEEMTESDAKTIGDTESNYEDKTINESSDERQIFDDSSYTDLLKKETFTNLEQDLDVKPFICPSVQSDVIHLKITATQDESTTIEKEVSSTTLNLILDIINKENIYCTNEPVKNLPVESDCKNPQTIFFTQLVDEDDNVKIPTFLTDSEVNLLRNESLTKSSSKNLYNSSSECNLVEKHSQNQDISVVRLTNLSRKLVEEILTLKCQLETSNNAVKDLESKLQDQMNYESSVTAAYTKYTVSNNTVGEVASDMLAEEESRPKIASATKSLLKLTSSKTIICEKMTQKNFFGTKKLFTAVNRTMKKIFNILNTPVLDGMFDKMYQDIAERIPERKIGGNEQVEKSLKKDTVTKITKKKDKLLKKYLKLVKRKILNIVYVNSVLIHMYVVTDKNALPTFRNLQNYSKYTILNRHFYWDKRNRNKKKNYKVKKTRTPVFDFPKTSFAFESIPPNATVFDVKQLKKTDVVKRALFYF